MINVPFKVAPRRANIAYGPLGPLEVAVRWGIKPVVSPGYRAARNPAEIEITDYTGIGRVMLAADVWFLTNDRTPPGRYTITRLDAFGDSGWAVLASNGAVASCRMDGAAHYLGPQERAQEWCDALNELFGSGGA